MKEAPKINIKFIEFASNPVNRTQRGHVALLIKDTTLGDTNLIKVFKKLTDVEGLTDENTEYVKDIFIGGAAKVTVINITENHSIDKAIKLLSQGQYNYVGVLSGNATDHNKLSKYIQVSDTELKTIKGVFYKQNNLDCMHSINILNETITFNDDRGEQEGWKGIPYILGVLAGMPLSRGATNYNLKLFSKVSNVDNADAQVKAGNMVLSYDGDKVKILSGRNTLTTIDKEHSQAMQSIVIVEAIDLMRDDITENFKLYIGGYKNTYSVQTMIISSINAYLKELARLEVLDPEYNNKMTQDIAQMRLYWESKGQDVSDLTDGEIRKKTCGTNVYFVADVKILEVIENFNLQVHITV